MPQRCECHACTQARVTERIDRQFGSSAPLSARLSGRLLIMNGDGRMWEWSDGEWRAVDSAIEPRSEAHSP